MLVSQRESPSQISIVLRGDLVTNKKKIIGKKHKRTGG